MRSGPRARGASSPNLIASNRHMKLDQGPTIHAACLLLLRLLGADAVGAGIVGPS
jgi:hypothetical protein